MVHTAGMAEPGDRKRVGMLAPMEHELEPLVRRLALERDGDLYRGQLGEVEVVAILTNIGMAPAREAAQRMLTEQVSHMIVEGIAGGIDRTLHIGDLVVPELVIDRATGTTYRPSVLGDLRPRGLLSSGDNLVLESGPLADMLEDGILAVDMETAAVAAVCDDADCPWSVFRAISDYPGEGLIDDALFALTKPDGTADPDAIARYLDANPDRKAVLARLAHDLSVATEAAAGAAIRACAAL
jgi:adenosylhomocysteine nucleosidase